MRKGGRRSTHDMLSRVAEDAREAERTDIARELHDTVIQPLAALLTSLESLSQRPVPAGVIEAYLSAWAELAQEAIVSLRAALAGLHNHPHAELGLPEAVHRFLVPQARSQGIRLTLESRDWVTNLPVDWTSSLYLMVREALTNVQKHARATEVTILLQADEHHLRLIIADNGVGFCPDEIGAPSMDALRGGFGILGMRERVQILGGSLALQSAPGIGTHVEVTVPRPLATQAEADTTDLYAVTDNGAVPMEAHAAHAASDVVVC